MDSGADALSKLNSSLTFMQLHFLIYKLGEVMVSPLQFCCENLVSHYN